MPLLFHSTLAVSILNTLFYSVFLEVFTIWPDIIPLKKRLFSSLFFLCKDLLFNRISFINSINNFILVGISFHLFMNLKRIIFMLWTCLIWEHVIYFHIFKKMCMCEYVYPSVCFIILFNYFSFKPYTFLISFIPRNYIFSYFASLFPTDI